MIIYTMIVRDDELNSDSYIQLIHFKMIPPVYTLVLPHCILAIVFKTYTSLCF